MAAFDYIRHFLIRKMFFPFRETYPSAWMNLGILLAARNRNEEALAKYNHALQLRPKYANCYYNMGNLVSFVKFANNSNSSH